MAHEPAQQCYYHHAEDASQHFACFDGASTVCPRCCLESCPSREAPLFLRCRAAGRPTWPPWMHARHDANPPLLRIAPRKLICLETYWDDHVSRIFRDSSVRPFLAGLAAQFDPAIVVAHRFVETSEQLTAYAGRGGILWRDRESFDTPVYYLSFHGAPGTLRTGLERIGRGALLEAFAGWGASQDNLVYFGACSVFAGAEGEGFARDFLAASKCRAVVGYATDIHWMESMLTDLLFLQRFYRDSDPWTNLAKIHASVLEDFAPARRLGLTLYSK